MRGGSRSERERERSGVSLMFTAIFNSRVLSLVTFLEGLNHLGKSQVLDLQELCVLVAATTLEDCVYACGAFFLP